VNESKSRAAEVEALVARAQAKLFSRVESHPTVEAGAPLYRRLSHARDSTWTEWTEWVEWVQWVEWVAR